MEKSLKSLGFAVALLLGALTAAAPTLAAPPTVQFSPGYDARLAESRKGQQTAPQTVTTTTTQNPPAAFSPLNKRRHH